MCSFNMQGCLKMFCHVFVASVEEQLQLNGARFYSVA